MCIHVQVVGCSKKGNLQEDIGNIKTKMVTQDIPIGSTSNEKRDASIGLNI